MQNDPAERAVTAADVARLAGVSTAVVSYVVNGGPRAVAPTTADRVQDAIRVLGYRPNLNARALKSGRTQLLGLVLPDSTNPHFAELAHAVQQAAGTYDRVVVTVNHGGSPGRQRRVATDLVRRGVDHLLIASPVGDTTALSQAVPTVLIDCAEAVPGTASVSPDSEAGTAAAVRHLIATHGHRRVGIALGESGRFGPENRERGWRRACEELGAEEGPIERGPFSREGGYAIGRRLLEQQPFPTAVLASSDLQAFGILRACWERGLHVPDDLAVITFDGTLGTRYSWPSLTAVRQPTAAMAAAAVDAVLALPAPRPVHQLFGMDLLLRRSCGCASAADQDDHADTDGASRSL